MAPSGISRLGAGRGSRHGRSDRIDLDRLALDWFDVSDNVRREIFEKVGPIAADGEGCHVDRVRPAVHAVRCVPHSVPGLVHGQSDRHGRQPPRVVSEGPAHRSRRQRRRGVRSEAARNDLLGGNRSRRIFREQDHRVSHAGIDGDLLDRQRVAHVFRDERPVNDPVDRGRPHREEDRDGATQLRVARVRDLRITETATRLRRGVPADLASIDILHPKEDVGIRRLQGEQDPAARFPSSG